jgi:tetrahydromethanopterin S-methyltransferase subunit A
MGFGKGLLFIISAINITMPHSVGWSPSQGTWPILEGRYKVGNPVSPIAICTMATVDMDFPMEKIAIAGKCVTENMGIEKIVKNTISNPHIRYMIICGKVPMGHFVDNALISLIDNGVDHEGRIIGAKGGIPVVKNLTKEEIERFRKQIIPINMADITDVSRVMEKVDELFEKNPGPFEGGALVSEKIPEVQASHTERDYSADPKGYFTIHANQERQEIIVEHHDINGRITKIIAGKKADDLYHTIVREGLVSRLEHASYLGRELAKAQIALRKNLNYVQDSDLEF